MRLLSVAAGLALALALATVATGAASPVRANLHITVWPEGEKGQSHAFTLRCRPAGGSLPARLAACRLLASQRRPFRPIPHVAVCTAQYGGPQVAVVRGTLRGLRVTARFERRNGCEIARWDRLRVLFPLDARGSTARGR